MFVIHSKEKDILSGAKEYRRFLERTVGLRLLSDKLKEADGGGKILGASQIYLWGDDVFGYKDIENISGLIGWLQTEKGKIISEKLPNSISAYLDVFVDGKADLNSRYRFVSSLSSALYETVDPDFKYSMTVREQFVVAKNAKKLAVKLMGDYLTDSKLWGNGFSVPLVEEFHEKGLKKLWLGVSDWRDTLLHPEAVKLANNYGYLTTVYDSYNTAVPDGTRWLTAEMGEDILKNGAIKDKNGKPVGGFGARGVYTNLDYVDEYMKKRINDVVKYSNINSYFLDVEGTATVFNDYSLERTTTKPEMIRQRNERMKWLEETFKIPVGSEGGNVLTSSNIIFAQGLALGPLSYWKDGNIFKDKKSKYYRGNYTPTQEPSLYFKPYPAMPKEVYDKYFNPIYKVPLYQIVLHDSVILSNHWRNGMFKLPTLRQNQLLKTLLYMNAPLYHLNWNTLADRVPAIVEFDKVFRPLHERLATEQMIDFKYLSDDKLLQSTYFADGTQIIVNFSEKGKNYMNTDNAIDLIDGYTMIALFPDKKTVVYNVFLEK